jgi:pimeloyl-ACP methyl ester carboxylesterase
MRHLGLLVLLLAGCSEERRYFIRTDDGAHLRVVERGPRDNDAVVIFLHGGPAGDVFDYTTGTAPPRLEQEARFAYVDQRGMGASVKSGRHEDYDLARAGRDVEDVVEVLRLRYGPDTDLYLMGHSWGGSLGTVALLDTGIQDELTGWIEAAGCHDSLREPRYAEARMREVAAVEIEEDRNAEAWGEILEFLDGFDEQADAFSEEDLLRLNQYGYAAEALVSERLAWEDQEPVRMWERYRNGVRSSFADRSLRYILETLYDDWLGFSPTPRLGEITLPALYLYADYDFVCPVALGEDAAAANPNGVLVTFEASGHSLMINETDKYVTEITDFLLATRR